MQQAQITGAARVVGKFSDNRVNMAVEREGKAGICRLVSSPVNLMQQDGDSTIRRVDHRGKAGDLIAPFTALELVLPNRTGFQSGNGEARVGRDVITAGQAGV